MTGSLVRLNWDRKGKPRATITKEGARFLTNYALANGTTPTYEIQVEAVAPNKPYIRLVSAAINNGPEKQRWVRSSIYVPEDLKVEFSLLMAAHGLTTCEAHRRFMELQVELAKQGEARTPIV